MSCLLTFKQSLLLMSSLILLIKVQLLHSVLCSHVLLVHLAMWISSGIETTRNLKLLLISQSSLNHRQMLPLVVSPFLMSIWRIVETIIVKFGLTTEQHNLGLQNCIMQVSCVANILCRMHKMLYN